MQAARSSGLSRATGLPVNWRPAHPCARPKTSMVATTSSLEHDVVQRLGLFAQTPYLSWERKESSGGKGSGI